MKRSSFRFLAIIVGMAFGISALPAQGIPPLPPLPDATPSPSPSPSPSASPSPEKDAHLTLLKGDLIVGTVELRDDYTLHVTSESGIANIPIAMLNDAGFKKYGFQKDRSQDGRFWSERQDALEGAKADNAQNPNPQKESTKELDISLAEIGPFQPFIQAYQQIVQDKKAAAAQKDGEGKTGTASPLSIPSGPTQAVSTLTSAITTGVSSIPGASIITSAIPGGLPSAPVSVPSAPSAPSAPPGGQ